MLSELDEEPEITSPPSDWELCSDSNFDARSAYTVIDGASEPPATLDQPVEVPSMPTDPSFITPPTSNAAPGRGNQPASGPTVHEQSADVEGESGAQIPFESVSTSNPLSTLDPWCCRACLRSPTDPVATICGHVFCQRCVMRSSLLATGADRVVIPQLHYGGACETPLLSCLQAGHVCKIEPCIVGALAIGS